MSLAHLPSFRPALSTHCEPRVLLMIATLVALSSQLPQATFAQPENSASANADASNDNWRRTSAGWEQLKPTTAPVVSFSPSHHVTLAQLWPGAWAACMILAIASLPCGKKAA